MDKANESLREFLKKRKGQITRLEVLNLVENCFNAVRLLVQNGLVHQDIRADNVLLVDGQARLADFGLMIPVADFYNVNKNIMWNQDLYYIPPEMVYARDKMYFKDISTAFGVLKNHHLLVHSRFGKEITRQWLDGLTNNTNAAFERIINELQAVSEKPLPTLPSSADSRRKLTQHHIKKIRTQNIMEINESHKFHTKYDVFSLGLMLLECDMYTIERDKDDPAVVLLYQKLIKGCGSVAPDSRFTVDQALSVFAELRTSTGGGKKTKLKRK
jgi:serine/threonine protein kinase